MKSTDYGRDGFGRQMAGICEASVRQEARGGPEGPEETDKEQVHRRLQPNAKN